MIRPAAMHIMRILLAGAVSMLASAAMIWAIRTWSFFDSMTLLVIPIATLLGLLPIIHWYRRDAYPIGLVYCLAMFFLLRWFHQLIRTDS
jgi:hypothetical protein